MNKLFLQSWFPLTLSSCLNVDNIFILIRFMYCHYIEMLTLFLWVVSINPGCRPAISYCHSFAPPDLCILLITRLSGFWKKDFSLSFVFWRTQGYYFLIRNICLLPLEFNHSLIEYFLLESHFIFLWTFADCSIGFFILNAEKWRKHIQEVRKHGA